MSRDLGSRMRWALAAAMGVMARAAPLNGQPCAPAWSDEFALQVPLGMNGPIYAVTEFNGELIAGGGFTTAGGVPANHIARWDGTQWRAFGSGTSGNVYAILEYSGELLAGGEFPSENQLPNGLVRWNGVEWSPFNNGMSRWFAAVALEVHNEALIASGAFLKMGGDPPVQLGSRTARWDGTEWSSLGDVFVDAFAVYTNELLAGSQIMDVGGIPFNNIARWDVAEWSPLGGGTDDWVAALLVHNNELIAGGGFTVAGGVSANSIACWNGVQWRPLGSGMNDWVSALTIHDDELIASAGRDTAENTRASRIARWNGIQWSPLGSEVDGDVSSLTHYNGELVAGGDFSKVGVLTADNIARWDGGGWLPLGVMRGGIRSTPSQLVRVNTPLHGLGVTGSSSVPDYNGLSIFTGDAWRFLPGRGANFTDLATFDDGSGSGPALYIADQRTYKWTGAEWTLLGTGKNDTVTTIEVYDDGDGVGGGPSLYSAGNFYTAGGVPANRIARWDGQDWNALVTLGGGLADGQANDMAVYDDGTGSALYVAGEFTFVNDDPIAYLARWNGTSWSRVGAGVNGPVTSLKVLDDGSGPALHIRGSFTEVGTQTSGGIAANRIARWDGTWSGLGGGIDGPDGGDVNDLAVFNDGSGPRLYAAGSFTSIGGVQAKRAARWNGTTGGWESLGNFGLNETARTMAVFHDGAEPGIFYGGDFTVAGGLAARHVAKWNGLQWSVLGLGTSGPVNALAEFESPEARALYIGGNFTSAGGVPASYFTRYEGCPIPPPASFDIVDPSDGSVGVVESPVLRWAAANGAEQYTVVLSMSPTLADPIVSTWSVFPEWAVPSGLLVTGRRYYWGVAASNAGGQTSSMPVAASFVVGALPPPCEGDADESGGVNFADITAALTFWGMSGPGGDANHDGVVNFADISAVLTNWGMVCP